MRERLAKAYAVALVLFVTALAALFAQRQNADGRTATGSPGGLDADVAPRVPPPNAPPDPEVVARGRDLVGTEGCLRCHRVAGEGSPRSVLDGVGARLFPEEIRAGMLADDTFRAELPASVARAKAVYREMPGDALDALVTYLITLRGGARPEAFQLRQPTREAP